MQIYDQVRATGRPNYQEARIPIPSALNHTNWEKLLKGYHDMKVLDYLKFGWPINYIATHPPTPSFKNHASATFHDSHIIKFILKEKKEEAILGPFDIPPFAPWFQTSPLLTREKTSENPEIIERRVIIDLSFPEGKAVNDGINKETAPDYIEYNLPRLYDFTDNLLNTPKAFMWKCDLRRAYRQMRLCPLSYPLLGIIHAGKYYIDICPSFGCRTSGGAQQRASSAVCFIFKQQTGADILAYVDDFISYAPTREKAQHEFKIFHQICELLGLQLSPEKSVPPCQNIDWLGFNVDSISMTVTIPEKKLCNVLTECQLWLMKKVANKKQLQSLAGRLIHISQAIPPARRFMSRILTALRDANTGPVVLSDEFKLDIKWFIQFAAMTNGVRLIKPVLNVFEIECDSSLLGGGAYAKSTRQCYSLRYPPKVAEGKFINQLEAFNAIIALKSLIPRNLPPSRIQVITDNVCSMNVLSSGKSKDSYLAACSREIFLIMAKTQHDIVFKHAPGESLIISDALSRSSQDPTYRLKAAALIRTHRLNKITPCHCDNVLSVI